MAKKETSSTFSEGVQDVTNDPTAFVNAVLDAVKDWEDEHVGFPPYWNPEHVGNAMLGKLILKDTTQEEFTRYVFMATKVAIPCKRGPAASQEEVLVQPGEMFTMSSYAALPIDMFFDLEMAIIVKGTRQLPGNEASKNRPRDLWEFSVKIPPEAKKALAARRKEVSERLLQERLRAAGALTAKTEKQSA